MIDRIAKQQMNVILLIDCSKSMQGKRMAKVNKALSDIKDHLVEMQNDNANVNFQITVITFSTESYFLNNQKACDIEDFKFDGIKGGGWSNLHLAYEKLGEILKKQRQGGIMPDFGGVAPIILLMTDGHPTKYPVNKELDELKRLPWFKVALKYGISIELNDDKTKQVLRDFAGENGDVIDCIDSEKLENIIKIIVLTASKVKSSNTSVNTETCQVEKVDVVHEIKSALEDDDWEW